MKQPITIKIVSALLIFIFAFASLAPAAQAEGSSNTIVDVALAANAQSGEFSILIAALKAANPSVIKMLSGDRDYTVFAPTDAAFQSLLAELNVTADQLLADKTLLTRVLRYHIVRGSLDSTAVLASSRLQTLQGGRLFQENGVLTDAQCRTANIIQTDIQASNGYIHVIDRVVLPKAKSGSDDDDNNRRVCNSIVDVAKAVNAQSGEFSILIAALQAADPVVIETLSSKGLYTVFAPTDAAFQSLLTELNVTADQLLSDQALLTSVLLYHVTRGSLDSTEVLARSRIRTLQGGFLSQANGVLTDAQCRSANIIQTDIQASNGIIHVIDRVVLPGSDSKSDDDNGMARICNSIVDIAKAVNAQSGEFSILIAALQAAKPSLIERLSSKGEYTVFAPTDAAFHSLLTELNVTADQLLADKALVTRVLRYHIVRGSLDSTDVLASTRLRTLQGGYLLQSNGVLTDANGRTASIIQTDIKASNGIIHVIDRVVLPKPGSGDDDD